MAPTHTPFGAWISKKEKDPTSREGNVSHSRNPAGVQSTQVPYQGKGTDTNRLVVCKAALAAAEGRAEASEGVPTLKVPAKYAEKVMKEP